MKKCLFIVVFLTIILTLSGCECKHETFSEATCEADGRCEDCGEVIQTALGHKFVLTDFCPASCMEEGLTTYECERCNQIASETVEKLKHAGEVKIIKKATLTKKGLEEVHCLMCGEYFERETLTKGLLRTDPFEIAASKLYKQCKKGNYEQYQNIYLRVSGRVSHISDYGNLKGYYLYGKMGEGLVCWVDGDNLVANTGSDVVFNGRLTNIGSNQYELTSCVLEKEVSVTVEPGLHKNNPIRLGEEKIGANYTNRWVSISGEIIGVVDYEPAGTWYYLKGDIACLSKETHTLGEEVSFVGFVAGVTDRWATVSSCESLDG